LNRRQFLAITAGITAGAALAGCRTESLFDPFPGLSHWPTQTTDASWRLLNRVTCGPRPAERRRLAHIGPAAFIEEQLAPESLPEMALRPRLRLRRSCSTWLRRSLPVNCSRPPCCRPSTVRANYLR
jgi:hypothetical protein